MPLLRTVLVLAALVFWSASAQGQGRTDVVTLLNGDRITGEIVNLNRGRLELKTDDAGTIEIEWDNIATLVATREFEIETSDGRRFLGTLGPSASRTISIVGADPVSLSMADLASIIPIGASFWAKLDGSVNAGFSYTRSSEIAQITLNSDTEFRRPSFLAEVTSSATITQQGGTEDDDDRAAIEFGYARYRGQRWFIFGTGRLENNESLGLVLRAQASGGVGLRTVNTNRAQLEVGGGLVFNEERGVDTEPTQTIEGLLSLRTSYFTYDRPKTDLDARILYYPNLSDWGRQRLQVDVSVSRELWKDFFFALDVYDTFDSDPPNPDADRNDVGVVTSVGWSY